MQSPELWFRPGKIPLPVLLSFIESRLLTATPRLGARNGAHPKGYKPGQEVLLRVLDEDDVEHLRQNIRIDEILIRRLSELTPNDLRNTLPFHTWEEIQASFSQFEGRPVHGHEDVSIITFSYL
ncbi:MAG TPA: hypothetical protein VMR46_04140 [Candidatus Paceibacterota bacterium]|nr:hypothetical protein [Candidatus Paceibacterota bacterium]